MIQRMGSTTKVVNNSLVPSRCGNDFKSMISRYILQVTSMKTSCETALRRIPQNTFDNKSTLVQVMTWFPQATNHYLSQCWPRSMSPYAITRPQWITSQWWSSAGPDICTRPKLTRTTRTPAFWGYPPPPHDYPYHWVILDPKSKEDKVKVTNLKNSTKFQIFEFWNRHYTRHTFFSCLIRCANMKWIRWVLLKIQSGHDLVHRRTDGQTDGRTDGQTDKVIPVYPPFNFVDVGGIKIICSWFWLKP